MSHSPYLQSWGNLSFWRRSECQFWTRQQWWGGEKRRCHRSCRPRARRNDEADVKKCRLQFRELLQMNLQVDVGPRGLSEENLHLLSLDVQWSWNLLDEIAWIEAQVKLAHLKSYAPDNIRAFYMRCWPVKVHIVTWKRCNLSEYNWAFHSKCMGQFSCFANLEINRINPHILHPSEVESWVQACAVQRPCNTK